MVPKSALVICVLLMLLAMNACQSPNEDYSRNWMTLFNGEDLKDWEVKIAGYPLGDDFGNTFRVEDGLLKVSYDHYNDSLKNRYGHLFYKDKFSAYLLVAEYRFYGNQLADGAQWAYMNNGLMLHAQSPESMGENQDYPISIECQLLGSDSSVSRPNANVCTPGTDIEMRGKLVETHCVESSSAPSPGHQWTHVEALVLGDSVIKQIVDTDTVITYQNPVIGGGNVAHFDPEVKKDGTPLKEGYIALQSESHPTAFRTIKLFDLSTYIDDPEALKKALYYLRHRQK